MALVLTPDDPPGAWLAALDEQIARSPGFFDDRPVILDLGALPPREPDLAGLLRALTERGVRVIGSEGGHPSWRGLTGALAPLRAAPPRGGKPPRPMAVAEPPPPAALPVAAHAPPPPAPLRAASMLVERPVRSGQSVTCEHGDVTVVGAVASGAEVIAGGSIHVYGALRGRAMAGLSGAPEARIFCRRLEAELIAVGGLYLTSEQIAPALRGRPALVRRDGEGLSVTALD